MRVLSLSPGEVLDPVYRRRVHSLPQHQLDVLEDRCRADVSARIPHADVVIGDWTGELGLDEQTLGLARRCVAIMQPTAGYQAIDIDAAARMGIPVSNTPGANARAVAEWVVMAMLAMLKNVPAMNAEVQRGVWRMVEAARDGIYEIAERTIGIVGFGHIGRMVAARLTGFDVDQVLYADTVPASADVERALGVRRVELDELCARSDVVTLHLPLTARSRGLIDARRLSLIGSDGVLVNTARGAVVDEEALKTALRTGSLKGAALDVFADEPLGPGHRWAGMRNVLLSPHLAGSTNESRERMIGACLDNLARVLAGGAPSNVVNGVEGIPQRQR